MSSVDDAEWDPLQNKVPRLWRKKDQACELSASAVEFLQALFFQFAVQVDGELVLREQDVRRMCTICPGGKVPWQRPSQDNFGYPRCVAVLSQNVLVKASWMALWSLMAARDPRHVMRYLWYLGLPGDTVERGGRVHEIHLPWPENRLRTSSPCGERSPSASSQ